MIVHHIRPYFRGLPKATSLWSLIFILAVLSLQNLIISGFDHSLAYEDIAYFGYGGPVAQTEESGAFLGVASPMLNSGKSLVSEPVFLEDGSLLGISPPHAGVLTRRGDLLRYRVKSGDTLSSIAAQFGISIETLRGANPSIRSFIAPGKELVILPVTGALYEIREGDSLESVAARYRVSAPLIKTYNPAYQKLFEEPGRSIVLPHANPALLKKYDRSKTERLPNLKAYFTLPARGWNWGELHEENAVDIADRCGAPVYAAQEGVVIEESSDGSWNQGYGNYLIVEHPNQTKTLYGHTAKNHVRIGVYVRQGEEVALIGSTGNTHGPTGCHLHFEVHGARNPFAIK